MCICRHIHSKLIFQAIVFLVLYIPREGLTSLRTFKVVLPLKVKVLVAQLCLTLCNPMDCSPPGFSVYGILQARILEWVAISFARTSS